MSLKVASSPTTDGFESVPGSPKSSNYHYFNSEKQPNVPTKGAPKCVVMDMDECMYSNGTGCIASRILRHFSPDQDHWPSTSLYIEYFARHGGFRPNLDIFMQYLYRLKSNGIIDEIVFFTSAPNDNRYIEYMRDCICDYSGIPRDAVPRIIDKYDSINFSPLNPP